MLRINSPDRAIRSEGKIIRAEDYAATVQAEDIIAEARREADEIVRQARNAFEAEKQRGYDEGVAQSKQRSTELTIEMYANVLEYLASAEASVVRVVENSINRVLGELGDREVIVRIVRAALDSERGQRRVEISVHPSRLDFVKSELDALRKDFQSIPVIEVNADPNLPENGCILRSEMGTIDASLERQLGAIRSAMERTIKKPERPLRPG